MATATQATESITSSEAVQEIWLAADLQKGTLEHILGSGTSGAQDTMPKKEDKEVVFVRKLVTDPSHQDYKTDLNLVKILAEQAKLISINPQNYLQEYQDPKRGFYLMEDSQGTPISVISVVQKDTHFASFKTGTIVPIKNAVVTEAGFAYQKKRSYRILKTLIVYAMTRSDLAGALHLPLLGANQYLVSKVSGDQKPTKPLNDASECSIRDKSLHIALVDDELGIIPVGYSELHSGRVDMTDLKRLNDYFSDSEKIPAVSIIGNGDKLTALVLLDKDGKMTGYAASNTPKHYGILLSKSLLTKLVA